MKQITFNRFIKYFLRGLLFVVPIALTSFIIFETIQWLDNLIPYKIPGLGLLTILVVITLVGYLASSLLTGPLFHMLEDVMVRVPLVNIIYTSLKDLIAAFVGDKKKFDKPVLVALTADLTILKPGFITQEDLSRLGLMDQVAVYLPHSYNFSGNLFIVPAKYVKPMNASGTDVMKFIVSGGVSGLQGVTRVGGSIDKSNINKDKKF
jgi:uncharacterized membrane protein